MTIIETDRLILRGWKESDFYPFIEMNMDPAVMKYFPTTWTDEKSRMAIHDMATHFAQWGYGPYAAELKSDGRFIGTIGLYHPNFESDFTPCVEILWRLTKDAWGRGLATEGAKEILNYGFNRLKIHKIYSFTSILNIPSLKVMEKIGMAKVKTFRHPTLPTNHELSKHWLYKLERTAIVPS